MKEAKQFTGALEVTEVENAHFYVVIDFLYGTAHSEPYVYYSAMEDFAFYDEAYDRFSSDRGRSPAEYDYVLRQAEKYVNQNEPKLIAECIRATLKEETDEAYWTKYVQAMKVAEMDEDRIENVVIGDLNTEDYPDFVDAFIESAEYDGVPMTEEHLYDLNENSSLVYEWVQNNLI